MQSEESKKLYEVLKRKGYAPEFAQLISTTLSTPWTARRMLGYLREMPKLREEDVVDEMLSILADRDRIREKKESEYAQSVISEWYNDSSRGSLADDEWLSSEEAEEEE